MRNKEPRRNKFKKSLYSKEDSCSSKDDDCSGLDNEDAILFLVTKKNEDKSKGSIVKCTTFYAKYEEKSWEIDNGCSNHMKRDRRKFIKLVKWNGGIVKLGDDTLV